MGKNIGKNKSKILSDKCSKKLLGHAKQSATDAFKTSSKKVIQTQQKQQVIWLVVKLLMELRKFKK